MKVVRKILMLVLAFMLVLPLAVRAEEVYTTTAAEDTTDTALDVKSKVNVYLFRGEGCPHCAEAEEWFESIEEEYGSKFKLVSYEVWNNESNASLMNKVAKYFQEDVGGVPYIAIGDRTFQGFEAGSTDEAIKELINEEYEKEEEDRFDVVVEVTKPEDEGTVLGSIIALIVVVGVIATVIVSRKKSSNSKK